MKIGIFYGSDSGNTEEIAKKIVKIIGDNNIDLINIGEGDIKDDVFNPFKFIIIGTSTWYDGDLQSDWEDFFPRLDNIDFNGKTVALFGLGDQYSYGEFFVDGIGIIYDKIIEQGAKVVGEWPTDGYDFEESVAERDGKFVGLPLDEDNENDKTDERVITWLRQISGDMGFEVYY